MSQEDYGQVDTQSVDDTSIITVSITIDGYGKINLCVGGMTNNFNYHRRSLSPSYDYAIFKVPHNN